VDALSAHMSDATDPHFLPIPSSAYNREAALASLAYADPGVPAQRSRDAAGRASE